MSRFQTLQETSKPGSLHQDRLHRSAPRLRVETAARERQDFAVTPKVWQLSSWPGPPAQIKSVLAGSSITLFSSLPIFSISIRTTSPALSHLGGFIAAATPPGVPVETIVPDRKSTRLNSSHRCISYAVF